MELGITALILAFIIYVIVKAFSKLASIGKRRQVYDSRDYLFTKAERSFLGVLDQATAGRYRVFGKIRVADLLKTVKGLSNSDRQAAFNRIKAKHVDFVLCEPSSLEFRAVIELNDSSHKKGKRGERDAFLRDAFEKAGIPFIEVPAQRSYKVEDIRTILGELEAITDGDVGSDNEQRIEPTMKI